jgi:hypothetical protein
MEKNVIPYIRIGQIIEFVKTIPSEELTTYEITKRFSRSTFQNILPSLQLLKIADYDKKNKTIKLTDLGKNFRSSLITNDEKRAAEIIKNSVDESEALSFVRGLLERKGSISILEIGRELAFKFNKKWDNVLTYKTCGAACASILGFVGFGVYDRGVLRKDEIRVAKGEITPPYVGFKKIVKIVDIVSTYGEVDIHTLSQKLETKEGRLSTEIKNCIDLGFLQRPAPAKVAITQLGRELIDPLNKNKINEIFRNALLQSEFNKVINTIIDKEFTVEELGNILKHQIGGKWLEKKTIVSYGKKFYNWLNSSKLLEEVGKGKYKIVSGIIREGTKLPEKTQFLSSIDLYELGKAIGIILSPQNEFDKVKASAEKLIELCKRERSLSTVLNLLEEHYKLFLELKDSRIFHADIKLIERFLGVEEWSTKSIQ